LIDACVQIPNGCGSFLGAVQLVLYAIYRNSGGNKAGAGAGAGKQQAGDDVEMASDAKSSKKVADDDGGDGKEDRLG
jgi:solute carrier family 50 protein (sugar transporter)